MTARRRVILGVDPGIALVGYGVLEIDSDLIYREHGAIATPKTDGTPRRLRAIYRALVELKQRHQVTDVAMEMLYYARNVTTAVAVGQARGVALLATVDDDITLGEYLPTQIKQTVAGYGGASKRQIQDMVRMILGLSNPPAPDDAADALAVAICHARHVELTAALARRPREAP